MTWTYAAVKTADLALNPAQPDPAQAAAALNAQNVTVAQDIATAEARQVILLTGEWYAIKRLSQAAPSGVSPPSAQDQAIAAASLCIDTLTLTETLHTASDANWAAIQPMVQALQAANVLSAASAAAWTAMRTVQQPLWQPALTAGDVQTARNQP